MVLRFAIGSPFAARSSSWKFWTQGDEAYLLRRGRTSGVHKFSFHKTGNCRWAKIQAGVSGSDRAMLEWQRDAVPAVGLGQASLLISVVFPTNHLSLSIYNTDSNFIWIEPDPNSKAILVEFFITKEDERRIIADFSFYGDRGVLYFKKMRSGANIFVAKSIVDCGPVDVKVAEHEEGGPVSGALMFPDIDVQGTGRPIRMILMPQTELPPTLWELGGHKDNARI
jgi:hypothetical protein